MASVSALLVVPVVLALVALVARTVYCVQRSRQRWAWTRACERRCTLVVLGSGGHTSEMLALLQALPLHDHYRPLHVLLAASDTASAERAVGLRAEHVHRIHRGRNVGQSFFSSFFSTFYACLQSLLLVYKVRPELVLCNGPGTCIPVCGAAFLMHVFGVAKCKIVFVESFCRTQTLSLSGKILYPFASRFFVQWPQLQKAYPASTCIGFLC